jgi:hypothetical protein
MAARSYWLSSGSVLNANLLRETQLSNCQREFLFRH